MNVPFSGVTLIEQRFKKFQGPFLQIFPIMTKNHKSSAMILWHSQCICNEFQPLLPSCLQSLNFRKIHSATSDWNLIFFSSSRLLSKHAGTWTITHGNRIASTWNIPSFSQILSCLCFWFKNNLMRQFFPRTFDTRKISSHDGSRKKARSISQDIAK